MDGKVFTGQRSVARTKMLWQICFTKGILLSLALLSGSVTLKAGGDHEHDEAHVHAKKEAGPNGGRIIESTEPHCEFYVTADRMVQISFLDDAGNLVKPPYSVTLIGGSRGHPTRLSFEIENDVLVSNQPLPEADIIPVVVQFEDLTSAKKLRERFNVRFDDCPTCEYKEYACICDHSH